MLSCSLYAKCSFSFALILLTAAGHAGWWERGDYEASLWCLTNSDKASTRACWHGDARNVIRILFFFCNDQQLSRNVVNCPLRLHTTALDVYLVRAFGMCEFPLLLVDGLSRRFHWPPKTGRHGRRLVLLLCGFVVWVCNRFCIFRGNSMLKTSFESNLIVAELSTRARI